MKNIFKTQLSWYLIPLLLILWYVYPKSHIIFTNLMMCVVIIGLIETLFFSSLAIIGKIINIIIHLLLLVPLYFSPLNLNTLSALNKWNFSIYVLGVFVILYLPFWPYKMSRIYLLTLYSSITLLMWVNTIL